VSALHATRIVGTACAAILSIGSAAADDGDIDAARTVLQAVRTLCPDAVLDPATLPADLGGALAGFTLTNVVAFGPGGDDWTQRELRLEDNANDRLLVVTATRAAGSLRRVTYAVHDLTAERPIMILLAGGDCAPLHARAIRYDDDGTALELVLYAADLATGQAVEPLNPPIPEGTDPGGVTVAHIDSGVNYRLPQIAARLARDGDGRMLGRDLWDDDGRPFDGDTGRSPFFPIRHGTPVASLLVKEAPAVRLLPIRYPRPEMARMAEAVEIAAAAGARIVALPMGSRDPDDWAAFAEAAQAHQEILFVVSAGNDGRDIDAAPLYPASLPLDNMVVVTSADAFGRLAPGSNWGRASVDLMVPAEGIEVTDYRGARGTASGSSYAVPRVAALAARLLARNPDWVTATLKRALFARAAPPMERGAPRVAVGWIPNPADDL
jgi:subtilisin family serine protease